MQPNAQYVGLEVSLEETNACVVDEAGRTLWRGCCASTPDDIEQPICKHGQMPCAWALRPVCCPRQVQS